MQQVRYLDYAVDVLSQMAATQGSRRRVFLTCAQVAFLGVDVVQPLNYVSAPLSHVCQRGVA